MKAKTIRALRKRLGETQMEFAKRFGVDQSTLHRWETDGPPMRGATRLLICMVIEGIKSKAAQEREIR